ncbi:hypothetical protein KM043_012897 [Ampulex compressa]|nr:hypothetical protein KM043_012897 [Ampulex compressa]
MVGTKIDERVIKKRENRRSRCANFVTLGQNSPFERIESVKSASRPPPSAWRTTVEDPEVAEARAINGSSLATFLQARVLGSGQFKKCIILFMVGMVCSILSYVIYIVNPAKLVLDKKLEMAPGSLVYTLWQKPPINVYLKVYIFNITNHPQFLRGEEKLRVQEIGPYVYQEFLENRNVTWNDNGTISYIPKRTVFYVPEMSVGNQEKDMIFVPNVPLLGVTSALHDAGFFVNYPLSQLSNVMDAKTILNISVHDYLWGYEDNLVRLASGIVPNFINFRKFGLLDRMYDEGDNMMNMNVRRKDDVLTEKGRYLSIDMYNGSPGLAHWGYQEEEGNVTHPENSVCNRIQGASEGTIFPPCLDKRVIFRVYRKAFCRPLPIDFDKEVEVNNGLQGYSYKLMDNFLDQPDQNPDNKCYCKNPKKCLKKGLSDLTPCYYNIPAAVSLPHFLNADPSLLEDVDGLAPDPEKHATQVVLQPTIGVPLYVHSRMQTNLVMHHTYYNSKITPFNDITIPLLWSDLNIESLPDDLLFLVKLSLTIVPIGQSILTYLLGIAGITMILLSLAATLWIFNQQQGEEETCRRDSTDLRMPLGYGQYTTIRILPAIKKITSRTDLFS